MITGEIKNKIDQIWDTFFVAGVTNPITVLEQMTYIFFMKMLDDKQLQEEDNARSLTKVVDGVDALDMNNRDAMGDVYEYILGKMAASGTNGQFRTPRHIIRMIVELMEPTPMFKPYAGVSTAVLVFTKTNSGGTDKVWFYDMKADILARLENTEGEYLKSYSELYKMLEGSL